MESYAGRHSFLPYFWLVVAVVISAPFCFAEVAETDAGWHLALGRLISTSTFPTTNALSWTSPNHHFYPTSWLFDLLTYLAIRAGGVGGLQLLVFGFVALTLFGVWYACSAVPRSQWIVVVVALLLVDRIVPRPHLASWALLASVLALCLRSGGRVAPRLACVVLIALGSNFHAGAIFSSVVLAIFCGLEAFRSRTPRGVAREALIAGAGGLALMANPGGPYNVFYAFRHLSMYETLQLTEFQAPDVTNAPGFFVIAPLSLIAAVIMVRRQPAIALTALAFIVGGVFAVRVAFKFYLVAAPLLVMAWEQFRTRIPPRLAFAPGMLLLGSGVASALPAAMHLKIGLTFDERLLPVRAVEFARSEGLDGRLWNGFTDGGYLEWALPEVPAFQDARVLAYDAEFFHAQQRAETSPEAFDRHLREWDVEWALTTNVPGGLTGNGLVEGPGWALVYWDDLSQIYVRRDIERFAGLRSRLEFLHFTPSSSVAEMLAKAETGKEDEVLRLDQEALRFQLVVPGDPYAALVRCATSIRLRAPRRHSVCDEAIAHATRAAAPELAGLARQLTSQPSRPNDSQASEDLR